MACRMPRDQTAILCRLRELLRLADELAFAFLVIKEDLALVFLTLARAHTQTHAQSRAHNMLAGQRSPVLAVCGLRCILWDYPAQHAYRRALPGHQPKHDVYLLVTSSLFHSAVFTAVFLATRLWRTTRASMKRTKYWWI